MRPRRETRVLLAALVLLALPAAPVACADEPVTTSSSEQIVKSAVDWVKGNDCQALLEVAPAQMSWTFSKGGWSVVSGGLMTIHDSDLYYRIDWPPDAGSVSPRWAEPTWVKISAAETAEDAVADSTYEWLLTSWMHLVLNQPLLALSLMSPQGPPSVSEDGSAWIVMGEVEMATMLEQFVSRKALARAAEAGHMPSGSLRVTLAADKSTGRPVRTEIQIADNPGIAFGYSWVPWIWQPAKDSTITLREYLEAGGR